MKRILALVILAVLVSANAFAARLTATLGDQDAAKNYRVQVDDSGLVTFAQDTSITAPYENIGSGTAVTSAAGNPGTGRVLTSADSGSYISDYGGNTVGVAAPGTLTGSGTRFILPACTTATLGYQFDFATAVKETITITPNSTADSIAFSISGTGLSAGQGIKNSGSAAAGDEIQVSCTSVGNWTARNLAGTWATST